MIDTYDIQICDHCGAEFTHSYFSGGTRSCTTCKITRITAREPFDEVLDEPLDDDWITEEVYALGDLNEFQLRA